MSVDRSPEDFEKYHRRASAPPVSNNQQPDRQRVSSRPQLRRSLSVAKRQFSWREPVRPFVSSTFLDFQKERDVLVKRVFPKLEQLCRSRCTYFAPVDLRWGITDEQAGSGDVIRLCLDYIAKSRPYFIGLIGERYGSHQPATDDDESSHWQAASPSHGSSNLLGSHACSGGACAITSEPVPASSHTPGGVANDVVEHDNQHWIARNFNVASKCGYPWLSEERYRSYSITALEIEFAAFRERFPFIRFYFRKPCAAPDTTSLESEFAKRSLVELKERIMSSGCSVFHYGSMEELGDAVMRDWHDIIDEVYPPLVPMLSLPCNTEEKTADAYGDLFNEWAAHEAFAESRRRAFVATPQLSEIIEELNSHIATISDLGTARVSKPIVVLTGERGSGKTALLANWSKGLSADDPDLHIVSHYVGSSSSSASVLGFMRHCIAELRAKFLDSSGGDREEQKDLEDMTRVRAAFGAALALGRMLVILDGMEEMSRKSVDDDDLDWLPKSLPPQCRIVMSTSEGHTSFRALQNRRDAAIMNMPLLVAIEDKRQLVRCHLAVHCKQLSEEQLDQAVSSPLADKPFFLASLANEMRIFGEHEKISERLNYYLSAKSASHLWTLVIQRWVNDYGQEGTRKHHTSSHAQSQSQTTAEVDDTQSHNASRLSGWVAAGLCLLAVSRYGLTDTEVLSALKQHGYPHLTSLDWASFRSAAGDALFERQGGLLCFFHQHLRSAVYECLLDVKNTDYSDIAELQVLNPRLVEKTKWHGMLGDYFQTVNRCLRRTEELPWQRLMSSDLQGLARCVCEPATFLDCSDWQHNHGRLRLDLQTYWQVLEGAGFNQITSYQGMLQQEKLVLETSVSESCHLRLRNFYTMLVSAVGRLFASMSKFCESSSVLQEALEHANRLYDHTIDTRSGNEGSAGADADIASGEEVNGVQLMSSLELLSSVQEQLADLNLYQLHTRNAESWYRAALLTTGLSATQVQSEDDGNMYEMDSRLVYRRGRLLDSLGFLKVKDAGPNAKSQRQFAHNLLLKAKKYMEVASNTPGQADVMFHIAVSHSRQGHDQDAERGLRDALRARKTWYGAEHPGVAEVLNELAGLLARRFKNKDCAREAEELYRQALTIRQQVAPGHILTATTLFHLAKFLHRGDLTACQEAIKLFREAWEIRSKNFGLDHVLTKAVKKHLDQAVSDVERMSQASAGSENLACANDTRRKSREESSLEGHHRHRGRGHWPNSDRRGGYRGKGRGRGGQQIQGHGANAEVDHRPTSPEDRADGDDDEWQVVGKSKGKRGRGGSHHRGAHRGRASHRHVYSGSNPLH